MTTENYVMYPRDIARETHRSLRFIYRQIKAGKIPGIVHISDRTYAMSRVNFDKWINGETAGTGGQGK